MSSENTPGVSAPGMPEGATVIETGEQSKPVESGFRSDTSGLSETQIASQQWIDANRGAAQRGEGGIFLAKQMREHLDHVFRGGPAPASTAAREQVRSDDARNDQRPLSESDGDMPGLRAELERPVNVDRAVSQMTMKGLNPEIASEIAQIADICGLGDVRTQIILDRALKHYGPDGTDPAADNYLYIDTPELTEEYTTEAAKAFKGGIEELQERSERVRRWLATKQAPDGKNMLAALDAHGLTKTSLAFDPRLLLQLCAAADRDGVA